MLWPPCQISLAAVPCSVPRFRLWRKGRTWRNGDDDNLWESRKIFRRRPTMTNTDDSHRHVTPCARNTHSQIQQKLSHLVPDSCCSPRNAGSCSLRTHIGKSPMVTRSNTYSHEFSKLHSSHNLACREQLAEFQGTSIVHSHGFFLKQTTFQTRSFHGVTLSMLEDGSNIWWTPVLSLDWFPDDRPSSK